jgi:hypothetical protein
LDFRRMSPTSLAGLTAYGKETEIVTDCECESSLSVNHRLPY